MNASHARLPKQRELDKSNIRFAGQCNPRCCTRWPAWRSTSPRTRGTGPAARHCWWRWCRCCLCTRRSHSYLPDAPRFQMPRQRWSPFLVSPERKTWIYHIFYHLLGSLSHVYNIPNKYTLRQLLWPFSHLGTPASMLKSYETSYCEATGFWLCQTFLWALSGVGQSWGFLFFILQIHNLALSTCSFFFHSSLALCHYIWIFELPILSAWIFWLTNGTKKSSIIQICFAAALKGTLQLNGPRQGYSLCDFSICALQSFYFCFILCRTRP